MSMIGCFTRVTDADLDQVVANPEALEKFVKFDPEGADFFDIDKAWHGIHFLLTDCAWEGSGPVAFILNGGRGIEKDLGYGPPRGFSSSEVKEIAAALQSVDADALFAKADQAKFTTEEIYPQIWDEPKDECIGYLIHHFNSLKKFVQETADANKALVIYLN